MKESMQNDKEIRVQDINITENTSTRSLVIFRNFLYVFAYMQSQQTKKDRECLV